MLDYLIVVAFLPAVIVGQSQIIPCPGNIPAPTGLRIAGCDSFPCHINQGDSISYEVDFSATHATTGLRLVLVSTVFGQEREVILPPGVENACDSLIVGYCPVTSGQPLTQGTTIPVFTEYHGGIPAQLRFQINHVSDGHDHACVCTLVDVIIH